jgi:hypothetical protein
MNDVTEDWAAYKAHQKASRAARMEKWVQRFKANHMPFSTSNGGVHCVFEIQGRTYDVWPSTDRWRLRGGVRSNFGIEAFVRMHTKMREAEDNAFVERMTRAYPHLKGEAK